MRAAERAEQRRAPCAAIAIVPLAALLVRATEQIAERAGSAVGGLLNATFGNAPELIIAVVALRAGEIELVMIYEVKGDRIARSWMIPGAKKIFPPPRT